MSSLIPSGSASGTGAITIQPVNTNNNRTVTIPDADGVVSVSGNMPAFSAYLGSNQTISSTTWTKVTCGTEEFDTNSCYDNSTNYRFTPTVAGYYQFTGASSLTSQVSFALTFYKNGAEFKRGNNTGAAYQISDTALIYCNGSTDYVEMYIYVATGGGATIGAGNSLTYFQAAMVRSA